MDLSRFTRAHEETYATALREIRNGRKISHWMWYIFPQMIGLSDSETSRFYAIHDRDEAAAFLEDAYLGGNLREITRAVLANPPIHPARIFGAPDYRKLQSCMTLFEQVDRESPSVFRLVLERFYGGERDAKTLAILSGNAPDVT